MVKVKKEFLNKLKNNIGEKDFSLYIKSLDEDDTHGCTVNLKKINKSSIDLDYLVDRFKAELLYKNDSFAYLKYDKNLLEMSSIFPGKDPLYHVGAYYIQEPTASMPLYNVDIKKDDFVLDLCASPGGKSCEALYNLDINAGGFLLANEIDKERAKVLSSNIERMGFDNAIVTSNSSDDLKEKFIEYFDKIILDAPCSGEGMFRKSEEARLQWSQALVESCAKIQKKLLDDSYSMLKKGGIIVYSTCTFSKEEDEENVEYILEKYSDMKLLLMEKNYPHNSIGEGQFFAILKKDVTCEEKNNSFITLSELKGLYVLRYGLKIEEEHNGKKMIAHAVTHNDNNDIIKESIELDEKEVLQYLHGDVIRKETMLTGWCKVTYKKMGLGLTKITNGVLKNHYPKGLRIN